MKRIKEKRPLGFASTGTRIMSISLPLQVASSKRYCARIIFKNETTSSKYESFKIAFPFYLADINIESFPILSRHFVQQAKWVVADESPLMRCEEFQTGKSTVGFGVQSDL